MRSYAFIFNRRLRAIARIAFVALLFCAGAGSAFSSDAAIQLTYIVNSDGTFNNSGQVALGESLFMSTNLINVADDARNWQIQGAGAIIPGGTGLGSGWAAYVAPQVMPAGQKAVVNVALASNPGVTTSYTVTLVNPVPKIYRTSANGAASGTNVPVTVSGAGFVPGTVILVNGSPVASSYQSPSTMTAQMTVPAGAKGTVSLAAQNPSPGGGTGETVQAQLPTIELMDIVNRDGSANTTGNVALGGVLRMSTHLVNVASGPRSWNLQGAGTLVPGASSTESGWAVYNAPLLMPASQFATVDVSMSQDPSVSTSYNITLVNPVPTVNSASPGTLTAGGTQTLTLVGSGFVPATYVTLNGSSFPITYVDFNHATVQVSVAGNASGTLSLQVQTPGPGGGAGTTFTESVNSASVTLTATDVDGSNTGTARLGLPVAMSATVIGSQQTAVNWSVTGSGSISGAGVYTPPDTMPGNQAVTIQATLASNSAITASYSLTLLNPVPTISYTSPEYVPLGATTQVTLNGTGFLPSTVVSVNGATVPTTYQSATSIVASIDVPSNASGNLSVEASSPTPGGGTGNTYQLAVATGFSATGAARLLDQTTFGPTTSLIQHVQNEGVNAWLSEQYNTPQTVLPLVPVNLPSYCPDAEFCTESEWWQTVVTGNDQLRQRVALALSEIFVVSGATVPGYGVQAYINMLATDAFSNWYTIMNDVTLSPAMGFYLNMANSVAPTGTLIANENYARENMQLFNIGLNLLNQDGSMQLDGNGIPIPTYTEAQVEAFARAYTGWTFANPDGSVPSQLIGTWAANFYHPMVALETYHDENQKTLLNGTVLPAGQTAEADLAASLTNIYQHPNLPPFICRQLIQHLVKSNPSPAYVYRVASVFKDNGNGVRGDMQAVLTAIFTDQEARAGDTAQQASDGHLREPILWITGVMRGLGYVNVNANNNWDNLAGITGTLGERPYGAPSVFSFFAPSYVVPGTSLNAPEFELENTGSVNDRLTIAEYLAHNTIIGFNADVTETSPLGQILVSQGPAALVSALNSLFVYGTMDPNTVAAIVNDISTQSNPETQLKVAIYLVISSSEYKILH